MNTIAIFAAYAYRFYGFVLSESKVVSVHLLLYCASDLRISIIKN